MTLSRYVLRQLLVAFAFALAGLGLVILPTLTVNAVNKVGAVGLGAILDYMPLVLIQLVPYVLPLAFMLACVATFGRLAADNELTAIRMAGIHPGRLLLPGLFLAALLAAGTEWMVSTVSPQWDYQARDFRRKSDVDKFKGALFERNEIDFGDFSLWAESSHGNVKENVVLSFPPGGEGRDQRPTTITAERLTIDLVDELLVVALENAESVNDTVQSFSANPEFAIRLDELVRHKKPNRSLPKYMTTRELRRELKRGGLEDERRNDIRYVIQSRHALAVTYLLFLLLGVPTGIYLRAGTQLAAFTGAMGYALLYYLLSLRLGKELAAGEALSPELAAWATDGIFLVVGLVMTWRGLLR